METHPQVPNIFQIPATALSFMPLISVADTFFLMIAGNCVDPKIIHTVGSAGISHITEEGNQSPHQADSSDLLAEFGP